jgi:hypothetical protein
LVFSTRLVVRGVFSAGLEARLYGRQGCPPLLAEHPHRKQLRDLHMELKVKQPVASALATKAT